MSDDDAAPQNEVGPSVPAGAIVRELHIINKRGLHARASAKFVQMVERFNAEVWVTRGSETVGGTSIMGLMMLAAGPGTTLRSPPRAPRRRPRSMRSPSWSPRSSTKKACEASRSGMAEGAARIRGSKIDAVHARLAGPASRYLAGGTIKMFQAVAGPG